MKRIMMLVMLLSMTMGTIPCREDCEGWVSLFNGKDLKAWERKGGEAVYTIEDGAIVGTSVPDTPNSYLCTKQHFRDFILKFEFKGHPKVNSEVQFRSNDFENPKKGGVRGYQCELEDENQERDWSCGVYHANPRAWLFPR
jgi:hypothetical protein